MHGEAGRLGGSLDLFGVEAEAHLHVRARDREYRTAGQLRCQRTVEMPRNDSPHLRMTLQNLTERASIGGREAELVPRRNPGRERLPLRETISS